MPLLWHCGYCATVSFAELASANIVGYENKAIDTSKTLNAMCATFSTVVREAVMGDITANATFAFGSDTVQIINPANGATLKTMTYLTAEEGTSYNCAAGWYDNDFVNGDEWDWSSQIPSEYSYNNYALPFGSMFIVSSGNTGSKLNYAGEVMTETKRFTIDTTKVLNFLGNATPIDRTFADITANSTFAFGSDTIQILNPANGATLKTMTYLTAEEGASYNCAPGWYDNDFVNGDEWDWSSQIPEKYSYNGDSCASGFGFIVSSGNDGAYLEIPGALVD